MVVLEKNERLRKPSLFGLSVIIHILLVIILSASIVPQKENTKKKELRVIKIARVIQAKDKKSTKTKKPKPKKKTKPKPKRKAKKSARKAPRLAKAQKVKTTRLKKSRTKVEKAKLKVVKKLRLQEKKRSTRKLAKAKTMPAPKKTVRKKISEAKSQKITKVVQKKKTYTKTQRKLSRQKVLPKKFITAMRFKTKQKTQKLKRKVEKKRKQKIIKPKATPKVVPKHKDVKKKIVKKKVVQKKKIEPVKRTFQVAKKLPAKINKKVPKRKIRETKKNIKIKKVTPKRTPKFKASEVRRQKIQKLNRVRKPVKVTRRSISKPRSAPKIPQPQKMTRKQVFKKAVTKPLKSFKPVRKKLSSSIKKQKAPKVIKKMQAPRKHVSLLAVKKTQTAPTMTTASMKDIVKEKPKKIKDIGKIQRKHVTHKAVSTPVLQEKPVMDSVPVVKERQIQKAVTSFTPDTQKAVKKEIDYTQTTSTPTKVTKTVKQKVNYQTTQQVTLERDVQPSLTAVETDMPTAQAPQMTKTEKVQRQHVSHVATTPVLKEKPVMDSAPVVKDRQIQKAETSFTPDTQRKVKKEIDYTQTTSTPTKVTKTVKQKVNYQTTQKVAVERDVQPSLTAVETDMPTAQAPQMTQTEKVQRQHVAHVATTPVLKERPVMDSGPSVPVVKDRQIQKAETSFTPDTQKEVKKEIDYAQTTSTPATIENTAQPRVTYQTTQKVLTERDVQPSLTAVETDIPTTEAPQMTQIEAASRKSVVHAAAASSPVVPTTSTSLDSAPTAVEQTKQTLKAATTFKSSEQAVEKEVEFELAQATTSSVAQTQKAVTYEHATRTEVSVREVSNTVPVEEFSPESQSAAVTNIASSARSSTHVQSSVTGSVTSNVKVDISQNEDLPVSDQSKEFTQADMTTDSGEEGDIEGKTMQTERLSDGTAKATEFATKSSSKTDFRGIDPSASPTGRSGMGLGEGGPQIKIKIPSGNMTNSQLFQLSGAIDGDIKGAFVTVNGNTQIAYVESGDLLSDIALVKGINTISVLAFNAGGGIGKKDFKLLYVPPQGVPNITLESPENGRQGAKSGDPVMVEGKIDDHWIKKAKLLLNGVAIPLKVVNGRFRRKIILPESRVTTFRIMAKGRNGQTGYSSLHTVLIGYDIDIKNPRPY